MTEDRMPHPTDLHHGLADQESSLAAATATPVGAVADYDPARPFFAVPHQSLGERFIGREEALGQVRHALGNGQRTVICPAGGFAGHGGLGQTQVAVEYAHRHRDHYPNGVIWLSADQDLDAQLVDLAVRARWIAPESEPRFKLEIARHRLRSITDCLIVFDNLQDPTLLRDYLAEPPAIAHLLVTSRAAPPDFVAVAIDRLDPDTSLQLLVQTAGRAPEGEAELATARELVRTLDGLPLTLELAGAQLSRGVVGFQDDLERLRDELRQTRPTRFAASSQHEANLSAILQLGAALVAHDPLLPAVLDALTWSGPGPMGRDLLAALVGVADSAELTPALDLGTALRLLQWVPGTDRCALHPLVQEVRRAQVPIAERPAWAADCCGRVVTWFSALLGDLPGLPRFEAELDHLRAWHDHALEFAPKQAARLTWLQIYVPLQRGQPQEMRRLIERAQTEYQEQGCDDEALLATLHHDFAYAVDAQGEPKRALELAGQALAMRRGLFGEDHPDTARSLGNVANYTGVLGDQQRALELTEQSLAIRRRLYGDRHRDSAASLGNLATYTCNLGRPLQALELAEQALAIHRDLYGERHPDTAASLNTVAFYTNAIREPQRALELAGQALAIHRALFGDRHPETAMSLNAMATYASALGDHQRALDLAQQGLAIQHALFGPRHPATAKCLHNTATYLSKLGKTTEAHARAQAAYDLFRQLLGAKHPQTLSTAKLLGSIKRPGFRIPSFRKGGGKSAKPRK
jgi:tetratricopeptide (TPR) repeat protein